MRLPDLEVQDRAARTREPIRLGHDVHHFERADLRALRGREARRSGRRHFDLEVSEIAELATRASFALPTAALIIFIAMSEPADASLPPTLALHASHRVIKFSVTCTRGKAMMSR